MTATPPPARYILVIDPEDDLRQVIALSLEIFTNWTITVAPAGHEGISLARSLQPDAILLNISVREVTTFSRLKAHPQTQSLPIIALVYRPFPEDRARLLGQGFAGAIALPLDTSTLHQRIADILGWASL
ncbi:MAG: response regulator [Cyanobacteria bacterium P01_D01_bin.123]